MVEHKDIEADSDERNPYETGAPVSGSIRKDPPIGILEGVDEPTPITSSCTPLRVASLALSITACLSSNSSASVIRMIAFPICLSSEKEESAILTAAEIFVPWLVT